MRARSFRVLSVACLATLACGAVEAADSVAWTGSGIVSLPLGRTEAVPRNPAVNTSGSSSLDPLTVEVIGGCGNFGGAAKIQIALDPRGPPYSGQIPYLTATAAGFCSLRATYGSASADIPLEVYDPATLQVRAADPVVAVPLGGTTRELRGSVVDAGGRHASNVSVEYRSAGNPACGQFGFSSYQDVRSLADGSVSASDFTGLVVGHCPVTIVLESTGATAMIDAIVFDPHRASMAFSPGQLVGYINEHPAQAYQLVLQLADADGTPLPRLPIHIRASTTGTAAAAPTYPDSRGVDTFSDAAGKASTNVLLNDREGYYDIIAFAFGREFRLPVVQATRGQPLPPPPSPPSKPLQDMWWGGPSENGWGASIVQHGDTLFAVVYGYDNAGRATWYVMPGGAWNSTHTVYSGAMYTPTGTPYYAYDAARLVVPAPRFVGSLSFTGDDNGAIEMVNALPGTLPGTVDGRKQITRQLFAAGTPLAASYGDMWWGGDAQNGWGIAVLQQAGMLFSVWFTYDANGLATWYVMPSGSWTASDTFEGRLYRTASSGAWEYPSYNPSALKATDAGTFRFRFSGNDATFDYSADGRSGTLQLTRQPF